MFIVKRRQTLTIGFKALSFPMCEIGQDWEIVRGESRQELKKMME
jgi:hypothetical protein